MDFRLVWTTRICGTNEDDSSWTDRKEHIDFKADTLAEAEIRANAFFQELTVHAERIDFNLLHIEVKEVVSLLSSWSKPIPTWMLKGQKK